MADPADWAHRSASAVPAVRVEVGVYPRHLPAALAAGWRTGTVLGGGGLVTVGRLKVITDGSLGSRTACCADPYPVGAADDAAPAPRGVLTVPVGELVALLRAVNVPARLVAVYAPGLSPMDFHAVAEAFVEGEWRVVDATLLAPRQTLDLAPADADRLGLAQGDEVDVRSNGTVVRAQVAIRERVRPGSGFLIEGTAEANANSLQPGELVEVTKVGEES